MAENWITETLYPDWGQRFLVTRELARVKSAFQDIVIAETPSHGRVMFLVGVTQITERDEFVYQEMLTHVPLLARPSCTGISTTSRPMAGSRVCWCWLRAISRSTLGLSAIMPRSIFSSAVSVIRTRPFRTSRRASWLSAFSSPSISAA